MKKFVIGMLGTALALSAAAEETVFLYSYHDFPPFVTAEGKGLTYELARKLNSMARGHYHFQVIILPRKRLEYRLASTAEPAHELLVVPWVAPKMFGDTPMKKYRWTSPLIPDMEVMVTTPKHKLEPDRPDAFAGLVFGGVLGHRYPEIQPLIDQHKVRRDDVESPETNLKKLDAGRLDFTMMSASTAAYFLKLLSFNQKLVQVNIPSSAFSRGMMLPLAAPPALAGYMESSVAKLAKDPEWRVILKRYGQEVAQ